MAASACAEIFAVSRAACARIHGTLDRFIGGSVRLGRPQGRASRPARGTVRARRSAGGGAGRRHRPARRVASGPAADLLVPAWAGRRRDAWATCAVRAAAARTPGARFVQVEQGGPHRSSPRPRSAAAIAGSLRPSWAMPPRCDRPRRIHPNKCNDTLVPARCASILARRAATAQRRPCTRLEARLMNRGILATLPTRWSMSQRARQRRVALRALEKRACSPSTSPDDATPAGPRRGGNAAARIDRV